MTDIGRQVSEDEKRLWRLVKDEFFRNNLDPYRDTIPVVTIASQRGGVHEERARQFVRTWANDGLVTSANRDNYVNLTEAGVRHSFEEE